MSRKHDINTRSFRLFALILFVLAILSTCATPHPVPRHHRLAARNVGSNIKDLWIMHNTKNYYCTKNYRVIPVDPTTGKMMTSYLRKRNFMDSLLNINPNGKEHGLCHDATWILLPKWNQPIPMAQAMVQYPLYFSKKASTPPTNQPGLRTSVVPNPAGLTGATLPGAGLPSTTPPGAGLPGTTLPVSTYPGAGPAGVTSLGAGLPGTT